MNRREFLEAFAVGTVVTQFPFLLSAQEIIKDSDVSPLRFDPAGQYGDCITIEKEMAGDRCVFDYALELTVEAARQFVPKSYKISVLYHDYAVEDDPFFLLTQLCWTYPPRPPGESVLGTVTM